VEVLPSSLRTVTALNPVAGAVEGFRWALYGAPLAGERLAVSAGVALLLLGLGLALYRRVEQTAADLL